MWMMHVCHVYADTCVMSHMNDACHIYMSCITWMTEACHIWMSRVTYAWVMSYMNEPCHIWLSHVTFAWVMLHMNDAAKCSVLQRVAPARASHPLKLSMPSPSTSCRSNWNRETQRKRETHTRAHTHTHTHTRMQQKNQNDYKNTNYTGNVSGSKYVEVQNTVVIHIINVSGRAMRSEMTCPIRRSILTHDMPKEASIFTLLYITLYPQPVNGPRSFLDTKYVHVIPCLILTLLYEACHIWMSRVTYAWVMSYMNEPCHICMRHVKYE